MAINGAQTSVSRCLIDSELGEEAGRVHSSVTVRAVGRLQVNAWEGPRAPGSRPCFLAAAKPQTRPAKGASVSPPLPGAPPGIRRAGTWGGGRGESHWLSPRRGAGII